jgi:very-short-patch-repair endonuclease
MTFSEVKLWNEIKNGQLMGYDFDRQRVIGNCIVDFYCKDLQLAIEVDGITHEEEHIKIKDAKRQAELEKMGVRFVRLDAMKIINKEESAEREIRNWSVAYESKHGVCENVIRRRRKIEMRESLVNKNPPLPLPGGDGEPEEQW